MPITEEIATWIANSETTVIGETLRLGRNAMIDIVGCMIAGIGDEATHRARTAMTDLGTGPARTVGCGMLLPAPHAALVNGTAAHALDFDDNYHPTAGHATAVLAPAIFALGDERSADGTAVLDAYVAGLEAMSVIGNGVNLHHYELGWHTSSTIGGMGVAAAAARLCKFDTETTAHAISLAFSMASGSKIQFGTMAKPLHVGIAGMNGLLAARYAEAGITATPEPLDGPWGFRDLYAGGGGEGYAKGAGLMGNPTALERFGLKVKIHPCCASVHTAVDALVDLMDEHGLEVDDIKSVETVVNKVSFDNLMFDDPKTEMEARFSMHYSIAVALLRKRLVLADFESSVIQNSEVRALYPKITMTKTSEDKPLPIAINGREPAETRITLNDGQTLSKFLKHPKGVLQNPLSEIEMWAKFNDCVSNLFDAERVTAVRNMLARFEDIQDLRDFTSLLTTEEAI